MYTRIVSKSFVIILSLLFVLSCTSSDRGDDISGGSVDATTNSVQNPASVNLLLDMITFDGNVTPYYDFVHPSLEIHVLNSDGELIGCLGSTQDGIMNYMGDAYLTYAEISAQFVFASGTLPSTSSTLTFRLIEKWSGNDPCPGAYVGDTRDEDASPDYVLTSTSSTIAALLSNGLTFTNYAVAYFRQSSVSPREVPLTSDVAGGQLAVDQMTIASLNTGSGETSNPEISLFIAEYGSLSIAACAETVDVDAGSILFGTMAYGFVDQDGNQIRLADINVANNYWFFLVERDTGDICPSNISGHVVLAYTNSISGANVLADSIDFENSYGSFSLYTK